MKTTLAILALGCASLHGAGEGYVNFIRQNQQGTSVIWDMPVIPVGNAPSALALESGGALFQLWTIEQAKAKDFLLDQKLVGAYLPKADVKISTLDPYSLIPRTRVDQPFTVQIDVSGLLVGMNLPISADRVLLEHHLANYTKEQLGFSLQQAISGTPASSGYIQANGATVLKFPVSSLRHSDPTKASGEEHFVVHALAEGGVTQTQIASAMVQVWPIASGEIKGIQPGDELRFQMPKIELILNDLYPRSDTYVQVYKGAAALGKEGIRLEGSHLVLDQDRSDSRVIPLSGFDNTFEEDGTYTMEIVHETPFGVERLSHVSFQVRRTLQVRAMQVDIKTADN